MTVNIASFTVKDQATIRDDFLRTLKNGLIQLGISNPQVGPGTDYYLWATALANELAVIQVNAQVKADAQMPDTATGSDLARQLTIYGLAYRPASPSVGAITLDCSVTTLIPTGQQLIDANGLRYQIQVGGTFAAGSRVPVIAVDTGKATNHLAGDALRFTTAPTYCNTTQLVATGGLTGGADVENDDTARARLFYRLQNPPGSGNAQQVTGYAEASTPIVQKGFCYPAVNGPSTCHVAVVGYATTTSRNRDVDTITLTSIVTPYILGQMPEYVETIVTTVTNVPTDVSIGLTLPSSVNSVPPGPGGGWVDGTPWPAISASGQTYANVTAITSSTQFTINAPTAATIGVSHIQWFDFTNFTLYAAKVVGCTGTAGAFNITIDQPFPTFGTGAAGLLIGTGPLIWPACTNAATYIAAYLSATALMGPGEKSSNAFALARGYRHPLISNSWPSSMNATILKALSNAGPEVLDQSYYFRSTTTPAVPGSVASPPAILVPRSIGFYAI